MGDRELLRVLFACFFGAAVGSFLARVASAGLAWLLANEPWKKREPGQSCKRCVFWTGIEGWRVEAQCRKPSPSVVSKGLNGVWPLTHADDWCGHFKKREEAKL